jgi:putative oxidoreductase
MAVLRAIARPLLGSVFAIQGLETLRNPEQVAPTAEPVVEPLSEKVPAIPDSVEQAVRVNGAVQLAGGTLLAIGWFPRLAALAIAGSLVPTTLAGHRFWEADEPQTRKQQRIHFLKNLSILGGLLIAAADTSGRPSLAWRSRHAVHDVRRQSAVASRAARTGARAGSRAGRVRARVSR